MTNEEMIEKLEQDGLSALSDMEFITNALEENTNLKAENEQLKSTISKMETTTAQEDDLK
jgi:regulator of replication initiation timing